MGVVYEAYDEDRHASVALKTLNRFDGDALARFKREFRSLQGLAHPNLVALDELFFESEQWFFTMELLDGVDFVTHVTGQAARVPYQSTVRESAGELAERPEVGGEDAGGQASFDESKLRDGLRQLLEGLSALHAVDKVHRDIKPSNVLVDARWAHRASRFRTRRRRRRPTIARRETPSSARRRTWRPNRQRRERSVRRRISTRWA